MFDSRGIRFALIGGLAVSLRGQPQDEQEIRGLIAAQRDAIDWAPCFAAMLGAPVTTLDFDFVFRDTPTNLGKLKTVFASLGAVILRPFYPVSKFYRMVDDASGLQADFMPVIHGVRSFEVLRARAAEHTIGGMTLEVASLRDINSSKKAAGRDRAAPGVDRHSARSATQSRGSAQRRRVTTRRSAVPVAGS